MLVVCDCETNGLKNPSRLWIIVCREVSSRKVEIFLEPDRNPEPFLKYASTVTGWIGHNFLAFDYRQINRLIPGAYIDPGTVIDTLIVSRLVNFLRDGHSLEDYGEEFGVPKVGNEDWSQLTQQMIDRCVSDTDINLRLYLRLQKYIESPIWRSALRTEHDIAVVCNEIQDNGFYFDRAQAASLLIDITEKVSQLEYELTSAFPAKCVFVKEVHPRLTKFGTLNRTDFRWLLAEAERTGTAADLSAYSADAPFSRISWRPFNPGSPPQVVERLNAAGWQPTEKTKTHFKAEKEYKRHPTKENEERWKSFLLTGWKISETNLSSLPSTAPRAAHSLVRYLKLNNRKKLLATWLEASEADSRVHPTVNGLGAWTGRASHSDPNVANIPTEKPQDPAEIKELNNVLRSLFCVPKDRLLVGVDADGIQLRILAHYIEDPRFTAALVSGDKSLNTDVHSLNVSAIGPACKGRRDAKTFIYAWLLGAGVERVQEILDCDRASAQDARNRFLTYYPGLQRLKEEIIPLDAIRGYFEGFDGRFVQIYGEDENQRQHYCLGGYLQNGESVIMKRAKLIWIPKLRKERIPFWLVNWVHDEWQTETVNDYDTALYIAQTQADSIRQAGEDLGLRCPMAGSILNAHEKIAINVNWRETH
jgi:DNA polymerase-1